MKTKQAHKSPSINPIETFNVSEWGGDIVAQEAKNFGKGFLDQIFASSEPKSTMPQSGDLQPGQEYYFGKSHATVKNRPATDNRFNNNIGSVASKESSKNLDIAAGLQYHEQFRSLRADVSIRETAEIKRAIEEIKIELQRLVSSSQVLQMEFGQTSFAQTPTTPGKYHVNFFQWVLSVIKQARMKVEDAGAWKAALKGKKNKQGFWGRAKKEGTTFLLHHDRNVATQAG